MASIKPEYDPIYDPVIEPMSKKTLAKAAAVTLAIGLVAWPVAKAFEQPDEVIDTKTVEPVRTFHGGQMHTDYMQAGESIHGFTSLCDGPDLIEITDVMRDRTVTAQAPVCLNDGRLTESDYK